MAEPFAFDVFRSHSSRDKAAVIVLASWPIVGQTIACCGLAAGRQLTGHRHRASGIQYRPEGA